MSSKSQCDKAFSQGGAYGRQKNIRRLGPKESPEVTGDLSLKGTKRLRPLLCLLLLDQEVRTVFHGTLSTVIICKTYQGSEAISPSSPELETPNLEAKINLSLYKSINSGTALHQHGID